MVCGILPFTSSFGKKQNQQQTAENDHEKKQPEMFAPLFWALINAHSTFPISSWADILTPQTWDKSPISLNWTVQVRKWQSDSPSLQKKSVLFKEKISVTL